MNFLSKNRRRLLIVGVIVAIPVVALTWYLGSPLFIEDEVDEALPENIVVITPTTDTGTLSEADAQATIDTATTLTTNVDEDMPDELAAMDSEQVTALEVKRGSFRDGDSFHMGSGDAIIFQLSTGEHLLRFENFEVTNGPDLHVYLVPRTNTDSVDISDYVDLGELKGNVGSQNYSIPAGIEIPAEASIVIWCEPFKVLFSVATLQ